MIDLLNKFSWWLDNLPYRIGCWFIGEDTRQVQREAVKRAFDSGQRSMQFKEFPEVGVAFDLREKTYYFYKYLHDIPECPELYSELKQIWMNHTDLCKYHFPCKAVDRELPLIWREGWTVKRGATLEEAKQA